MVTLVLRDTIRFSRHFDTYVRNQTLYFQNLFSFFFLHFHEPLEFDWGSGITARSCHRITVHLRS